MLWLLVVYILLFILEAFVSMYGQIPSHIESYKFIFSGPYDSFFWGGQVLVAVLLPLFILTFKSKSAAAVSFAALLIVLGFIAVRINIVIPAGIVPAFEGMRTAYIDSRLKLEYFPSLMEWLFELWVLSVGMIIFLVGGRLLRLFPASANEEVQNV